MKIKTSLLLISGLAAGISIAATYCFLTDEARKKVFIAGSKTVSSAKRILSAIDTSSVEDDQGDLEKHKRYIDIQWSNLGY